MRERPNGFTDVFLSYEARLLQYDFGGKF